MQTRISEILNKIGHDPVTVAPGATVYSAIEAMVRSDVGAAVVVREGGVCGIITARDYLRGVALKGRTSHATAVSEIMSSRVVVVAPDRTVGECMAIMTRHKFRHLPVVDGERLVGVISMRDLNAAICANQATEIEHLTRYITGSYPG